MFEEKPWGGYDVLDSGKNFKVKRIKVYSGHRLSLQFHQKRSEYWIIVAGRGKAQVENEVKEVKRGDCIFIPIKASHRMENKEKEELVFIEISLGDNISEDDIVRIEDDYGR